MGKVRNSRVDGSTTVRCPRLRLLTSPPRPELVRDIARIEIVAIGGATGGPGALATLIASIPTDFPVPIVIVQHMPALFTFILAKRLTSMGRIPVEEACSGVVLEPGRAWIAPGDYHLMVQREGDVVKLKTNREPPENACRPAVDVLFRSVAAAYGSHVLALVLTGMGNDGLTGSECVRREGGLILAQDEDSSVGWDMAGRVVKAGLATKVLPLDQLGPEIVRRVVGGGQLLRGSGSPG